LGAGGPPGVAHENGRPREHAEQDRRRRNQDGFRVDAEAERLARDELGETCRKARATKPTAIT
jgi:hypothetical protein